MALTSGLTSPPGPGVRELVERLRFGVEERYDDDDEAKGGRTEGWVKPSDGPSLTNPPALPNENGECAPLIEGVGAPDEAMRCAQGLAAEGAVELAAGDDVEAAVAVAAGPPPLDAVDQGPWNESNGLADEDEATEGVGAGKLKLKP